MAREVRWGDPALEDLHQAVEYIARDSRHYAEALLEPAINVSRSLVAFPERGRRVPELHDADARELFVQTYRLIYELRPATIDILAFVHGARDLAAWWEQEQAERKSPGKER